MSDSTENAPLDRTESRSEKCSSWPRDRTERGSRKRGDGRGNLGVGDVLVLADLLGDGGAELGGSDDVVEVVDLHDGGDGAAGLLEEVEHAVPRLLQRRRVRGHLHRSHRERHRSPTPPAAPPLALSLAGDSCWWWAGGFGSTSGRARDLAADLREVSLGRKDGDGVQAKVWAEYKREWIF